MSKIIKLSFLAHNYSSDHHSHIVLILKSIESTNIIAIILNFNNNTNKHEENITDWKPADFKKNIEI